MDIDHAFEKCVSKGQKNRAAAGLANPPSIAGESGVTSSFSGLLQSFACFLFQFSGFYILPGISEPAIAF